MRYSLRSLLISIGFLAFALTFAKLFYSWAGPVIPASLVQQLEPGLTKEQVRRLLGTPTEADVSMWRYQRITSSSAGFFDLYFDENGKLDWYDDESHFPGFP